VQKGLLAGTLAAVITLAFVASAHAIMVNGTDYALFAKESIKMETGR